MLPTRQFLKPCLWIALGLLSSPVAQASPNPSLDFSVKLFRGLAQDQATQNFVFSPYAIKSALGLAALGARGTTQRQLGRAPEAWSQKKAPAYKLQLANRLWVHLGFPLLSGFPDASDNAFGVRPWMVDLAKAPDFLSDRINGWVEEKTLGKIKNMVADTAIDSGQNMLLTSALYFKGDWVTPFQHSDTVASTFYVPRATDITTHFMRKTGGFFYHKTSEYQVVEIPYLDGEIAMDIFLPTSKKGWTTLSQTLRPEAINRLPDELTLQEVSVALPIWSMESNLELTAALKGLGIEEPFDAAQADFSGMTGSKGLFLGKLFHKTHLTVTETGTDAESQMTTNPTLPNRSLAVTSAISFHADHPFVFLIRHRATHSVLFMGQVYSP